MNLVAGTMRDAQAFLNVMVRREIRRPAVLLFAGLAALAGVAAALSANAADAALLAGAVSDAGRTATGTGGAAAATPGASARLAQALLRYTGVLAGIVLFVTPFHVWSRLGEDRVQSWPAAWFAAGRSRTCYGFTLLTTSVIVALVTYAVGASAYLLVRSDAGALAAAVHALGAVAHGSIALGLFAMAMWLIAPSSNAAPAFGILLYAAVYGSLVYLSLQEAGAPRLVRLLPWLTPPVYSIAPSTVEVLASAAYSALLLGVMVMAAERRIGWWQR
jgi:hypothetical protein